MIWCVCVSGGGQAPQHEGTWGGVPVALASDGVECFTCLGGLTPR
jgi:hypothetical protein